MSYRFKLDQEAIWFVVVAAGTVVLQALAALDVDKVADWRVWGVGLCVAAIRAAAGAALSRLSAPRVPDPSGTGLLTDAQLQQVTDELERRMKAGE